MPGNSTRERDQSQGSNASGTAFQDRSAMNNLTISGLAERANRVRYLVRKEFMHIARNRQNFKLLLIAPILQLLVFGYACRLDVDKVIATIRAAKDKPSRT